MKKFEEELKNGPVMIDKDNVTGTPIYDEVTLISYFNDWLSPEDYKAEIAKLNSKIDWLHGLLDERNEEVLQTVKLLNEAQPEIPEVPQFVADWYEENKDSLDYMIYETCANLKHKSTDKFEQWFGEAKNNSITTLIHMKNGYTVAKEKRFYLKNKLTKRYLRHAECNTVDELLYFDELSQFTQQEIDSMETGSYEQIKAEDE